MKTSFISIFAVLASTTEAFQSIRSNPVSASTSLSMGGYDPTFDPKEDPLIRESNGAQTLPAGPDRRSYTHLSPTHPLYGAPSSHSIREPTNERPKAGDPKDAILGYDPKSAQVGWLNDYKQREQGRF